MKNYATVYKQKMSGQNIPKNFTLRGLVDLCLELTKSNFEGKAYFHIISKHIHEPDIWQENMQALEFKQLHYKNIEGRKSLTV